MDSTTHVPPLLKFAETLFSDVVTASGSNAIDESVAQSLLNELLTAINPEFTNTSAQTDPSSLEALMAQLGMNSIQPDISTEQMLDELLHEQDNQALLSMLSSHLESALAIIQTLNTRPLSERALVQQVELQLLAITLDAGKLRDVIERPKAEKEKCFPAWRMQIRRLLLHEFNFINRLVH